MYLRRETPADTEPIRALTGETLADTLARVRTSEDWLPALCLVAADANGHIVGHMAGMRGHVETAPAVALTAPAVDPDQRGHGIGTALIHAVLAAADALGEPLAALTGAPADYYTRFGFRPAETLQITAPISGWAPYFQVRTLTAYQRSLRGTFRYPTPFGP